MGSAAGGRADVLAHGFGVAQSTVGGLEPCSLSPAPLTNSDHVPYFWHAFEEEFLWHTEEALSSPEVQAGVYGGGNGDLSSQ